MGTKAPSEPVRLSPGSTAKCEKCGLRATLRYGGTHSRCDVHAYRYSKTKAEDDAAVAALAALGKRVVGKTGPPRGVCSFCGVIFRSADPNKLYCKLACYVASGNNPVMKLTAAERAAASRKGHEAIRRRNAELAVTLPCDHCGDAVTMKPSKAKKRKLWAFCGRVCYRAFLSERFDRFIANPESVALPQNYDEFLDRTELPCPVEGCSWAGKHLSAHARIVHLVDARSFKEQLGFNVSSGLVSKDVAQAMSDAATVRGQNGLVPGCGVTLTPGRKMSLEGKEHLAKWRALNPNGMQGRRHSEEAKKRIALAAQARRKAE